MSTKRLARLALACSTLACLIGVRTAQAGTHSITHTQTTLDQTDFQALGFGQAGYYFAQFAASSPVTQRAPQDNMRFALPSWASMQFDITQPDRTFSADAGFFSGDPADPLDEVAPFGNPLVVGVYSQGGQPGWDTFTLPNGELGLSGSLVDEHTQNNVNNSVNRIQLGAGTPSSFLLRIVVDNTNQEHDPAGRLRARGDTDNVGPVDVDASLTGLTFNGTTDVYTFRYDNFVAGDFIKIQLDSGVAGESAGFAGIMFDLPVPEPSTLTLAALGLLALLAFGWRRRKGRQRMKLPLAGTTVIVLSCLLAIDGAAAGAIDIVSPAGLEPTEGNGEFILPSFDVARQQQVYPAVDFAALPASHRWVTSLALRTDMVTDFAFTATTAHVEVRLSTTSVDSLEATFDNNTGPDEVLVYSGPFVAVDSGSAPPGGPHPFEYPLHFDTPFHYDPAAGNLLVELRYDGFVVSPSVDVFTDAEFYGDSTNRLIVGFANTTTADFLSDGIDVLQFKFVPEPASAMLAALGLWAPLAFGWRRRPHGTA